MNRDRIDGTFLHLQHSVSRRAVMRVLGAGSLAATTIGAIGAIGVQARAMDPGPIAADAPPGKVFVGLADDKETFVAVILPQEGGVDARAYLCDGTNISAWLVGTKTGNRLELASTDWVSLTAQVTEDTAKGSALLADGRILHFSVARAADIAGLYDVTLTADDRLSGQGSAGQELEGRVVEKLVDGTKLLAGTVTGPDNTLHAFAAFASPDARGALHWIIQPNRQIKGGAKIGHGAGFIDPNVNFINPTVGL